jgi:hypothetical protein
MFFVLKKQLNCYYAFMLDDQNLADLLNSLKTDECKGKRVQDYLIMPIQRIPRYNMFLAVSVFYCYHKLV